MKTDRELTPTERLEEERDFLLRSLDDLDAEHEAGNVDAETYTRLHADYTARAAAAVRALRDGVDARPQEPRPSTRRRVLTIGGLVAFAVVTAVVLAYTLGARLPGQGVSGRAPGDAAPVARRRSALEAAVRRRPDDPSAHLDLARFRLARQDLAGALKEYDRAARLAPGDAEPRAYGGWILFLVSQRAPSTERDVLVAGAVTRLDAAVAVSPSYPDARFFRGMLRLRALGEASAAVPDFQAYLVLAPDGPLADQVRQVLAQAVAASRGAPAGSKPPTQP